MKPIEQPSHVSFYCIMYLIGTKFCLLHNADVNSNGMWATAQEAHQQVLMELLKDPTKKMHVYEIEWPTKGEVK